MSLTYQNPEDSQHSKTSQDTDTFQERFVELVPFEKMVWFVEFQSQEPGLTGQMRITWSLAEAAPTSAPCAPKSANQAGRLPFLRHGA
jgi:hypothetical protein